MFIRSTDFSRFQQSHSSFFLFPLCITPQPSMEILNLQSCCWPWAKQGRKNPAQEYASPYSLAAFRGRVAATQVPLDRGAAVPATKRYGYTLLCFTGQRMDMKPLWRFYCGCRWLRRSPPVWSVGSLSSLRRDITLHSVSCSWAGVAVGGRFTDWHGQTNPFTLGHCRRKPRRISVS
ncbi:uncharacterized protein BDV17DRAFT_55350 [Aspergillus undulatus]|uniref:uncharacterized protein n=1 Tax=Aspergillus undulatus TaxID=1810928 RepID=UPI003CCDF656